MDSNIVFILFLSTLQLAGPFSIINDYSLLKIMFGNITELKDLALPPMDEIKKYKAEDLPRKNDREDFRFDSKDVDKLLALIPVDQKERKYAYEILEFNAIMESLSKMVTPKTRRWWNVWNNFKNVVSELVTQALHYGSILADAALSYGLEAATFLSDAGDVAWDFLNLSTTPYWAYDSTYYRGREDSADKVNMEYDKMAKLEKLMICLLIHTRYRVDHAIRQRKKYVSSKSYRLGYLFNRLRRVKYLQAKAVHTANIERIAADTIKPAFKVVHDNYGWQVVRWYEKMIHLDQDLRDLCQLVYDTLDEVAPDPNWNPRERHLKKKGG